MGTIQSSGGFGGSSGRSGGGSKSSGRSGMGAQRGRSRPLGTVVQQTMNEHNVRQVSSMLGTDEATARRTMAAALPTLLAALGQEASTPEGAQALDRALARDHDGSVLDDISGYVARGGNVDDGRKILGHVLGGQQPMVENRLGQITGLDGSQVGTLLAALAPLVLGALGKQKREENMGPQDLTDMLGGGATGGMGSLLGSLLGGAMGGSTQSGPQSGMDLGDVMGGLLGGGQQTSGYAAQPPAGQGQGGFMDTLGTLLDRDRDGSGVDDMMDMLGGLMGGGDRR